MPMSFATCHEIVIGQPTTPIYAYIFPINCSEMYERTGVFHIGDEIYDKKSVCLVYAYPSGGFWTMHPYGDLYQNGEYKGSYEVMCPKAEIERCQRTQKGDPQLVIPYTKAKESYLRSMEKAIRKWGEMLVLLSHHIIQALETEKVQLQQTQMQSALPKEADPVSPHLLLLLLLIFTKYGGHYQIW